MKVINFKEARNNLKNRPDINLPKCGSIKETNYLLSSQKNKQILLKSLENARQNKTFEKKLLNL